MRTFEVRRGGERVGLWYFDPYARPGKGSGAWMSEYRTQANFAGKVTPIVSNNANFVRGAPGEPVLISWTDAVTLFHEFGHGLHGLNSAVTYPSLAGTGVVRDFVELPSQLFEHWLPTREVLTRFAATIETGEPMPQALVENIRSRPRFNQGFETVEYLASAILDMKAHLATAGAIEPRDFEAKALAEIGMPREIVMRHRLPHFRHIFGGECYAAGYYNYIWADALVADAAEAFAEAPGGFYDQATAGRLARRDPQRRRHRRGRRSLPPLPRPRRDHRRPDARPRLPRPRLSRLGRGHAFVGQLLLRRFGLAKMGEPHAGQDIGRLGELDVVVADDLDAIAPWIAKIEERAGQGLDAGVRHGPARPLPCRRPPARNAGRRRRGCFRPFCRARN